MGKVKLFPSQSFDVKQPRDPAVCRTPSNGILCAPSASGKTVLLVSMILEQYRGCFERVYIMSPSIDMDPQWEPVKEYIRKELGVNTDREQCWWDEWDEGALRQILAQQKKITQQSKQLGMKKLYQVLVCLDDMADSPAGAQEDRRWNFGHFVHPRPALLHQYLGVHAETAAHAVCGARKPPCGTASSGSGTSSSWTLWWKS